MNLNIKLLLIFSNIIPISCTFAAGLDRSGQSVSAFLQPGNYFEAGISVVDPTIDGKANAKNGGGHISDMAESYYFPHSAIKFQMNNKFSLGVLYDEPFGANGAYSISDPLITSDSGLFYTNQQNTKVDASTENLSLLIGYQPNKYWNLFIGGAYQTFQTNIQIRGTAFGGNAAFGEYNANMQEDDAKGFIGGISYQIPEKALRATITYRSEIKHLLTTNEFGHSTILGEASMNPTDADFNQVSKTDITMPQSINLDFQSLIAPKTVLLSSIRWGDWKNFSFRPQVFGQISEALGDSGKAPANPEGFDLLRYKNDQISATLGLAYSFNSKWTGNTSVLWDSGTGNPNSTLGPTKGYWGIGGGLQYSPLSQYFISGGIKYFKIGDADAQTASMYGTDHSIAKFEKNNSWGYGLKIGYRF